MRPSLSVVLLILASCAAGAGSAGDARSSEDLYGVWELRALEADRPGLRAAFLFGPGDPDVLRVTATFLMMGDVGLDPSVLHPGDGHVSSMGEVFFVLDSPADASTLTLEGRVLGEDRIRVTRLEWADVDLLRGGRSYDLVRSDP